MLAEYANLFALYEYVTFPQSVNRLTENLPALRKAYEVLSECEARLCLLEHLRTRSIYCWVKDSSRRSLLAEQLTNPLLANAQPLTVDLQGRGAFLTGKNGVGKSTFLRGLGLNILSGRAFGFCYCTRAELPLLPVWSSIQNEDSLETADSLYMAEMRRGETLLAVADRPNGAVFILDEIFRGTNNIESVAVSAAVVSHLADKALVVMSSHNLVLAPLLETRLESLRIVRGDAQADTLKLERGVIAETNGIKMMDDYAISESVRINARVVHDWFSGYVMKPSHFPELK
jgi:DNA mismatch repair ATPase MutS